MTNRKQRFFTQFSPVVIADRANDGFVEIARVLEGIFTLSSFKRRDKEKEHSASQERKSHACEYNAASNEYVHSDINVQKTEAKREMSSPRVNRISNLDAKGKHDFSEKYCLQMKELFHNEPERRFAAVQWFYVWNCKEAIPAIESVLLIENDKRVREQVAKLLDKFAATDSNNEGEK